MSRSLRQSPPLGARRRAPPGAIRPVVDHARCEAKAACVAVCPYDVFEVARIEKADYVGLGWTARIKVRVHGMKTAYTPRDDLCQGCGLCVVACPEGAIRLTERLKG